jgi:hypothetical protein
MRIVATKMSRKMKALLKLMLIVKTRKRRRG